MKKWICFLRAIVCCGMLLLQLPVFAAARQPYLVDQADLVPDSQEAALEAQLAQLRQNHSVDVVIVTADSLDGHSPASYADDFYDDNGYGVGPSYSGLLLLVSMEQRDWWISTSGTCISLFSQDVIDGISRQFLPMLSQGDYSEAFSTFAQLCDWVLAQDAESSDVDLSELPGREFGFGEALLPAGIIGIVFALIVVLILRGQLKSVRRQSGAGSYVRPGSMNLRQSHDLYLYTDTKRVRVERSSGTHMSSSGRSHGGGGGKF